MAYFLDQEHADAWTAVQNLAKANNSEADENLRRWVLEVQRIAVDQWVVRTRTLAGELDPVLVLKLVRSTSCIHAKLSVFQQPSCSHGWTARLCDYHQSTYLTVVCSLCNSSFRLLQQGQHAYAYLLALKQLTPQRSTTDFPHRQPASHRRRPQPPSRPLSRLWNGGKQQV